MQKLTDMTNVRVALEQCLSSSDQSESTFLTFEKLNPNIKEMEYAVRGPLAIRAVALEKELDQGVPKPFDEVFKANIGDCHAMGQNPITFTRQVLASVCCPDLITDSFPNDVKERAESLLAHCRGKSVGSYTDSAGIEFIRRRVADFIAKRDGYPCNWEDIVLCAGASQGIKSILKLFINEEEGLKSGIMVPIPQYPLYSATIVEFGMQIIGYYLDESDFWSLSVMELLRALKSAKGTCEPRAIVVINPGNPTGQVLSKENIQEVIKFAYEEGLFILADEVYQFNIYDQHSEFHSFKKVIMEMGEPYCEMEMASFMSSSKGYMGECGLRGGYVEIINFGSQVKAMYLKSLSAMLCPNVLGQIAVDCFINPPEIGSPSYELFEKEKSLILASLAERAKMVAETCNGINGMSCNPVQGAMYAFPRIYLPPKAIKAAESENLAPDAFYAFQLLEETGICVIPGSGFGQVEDTYHFRTTILPQTKKLKIMLKKLETFHEEFLEKYQ